MTPPFRALVAGLALAAAAVLTSTSGIANTAGHPSQGVHIIFNGPPTCCGGPS
jgi:hypothetical protein